MRKLALRDEVLMQVEKPARYIGNEINMVKKNPREVDVRFCMCFPDVYEIGMSHLGIQILYDMFNRWDDTYCERLGKELCRAVPDYCSHQCDGIIHQTVVFMYATFR